MAFAGYHSISNHIARSPCMPDSGRLSPLQSTSFKDLPKHARHSLRSRASSSKEEPGSKSSQAENAMAERIRRAKEYKQRQEGALDVREKPGQAKVPLANADNAVLDEFNRNLAQYGEEVASKQQDIFTTALEDVRNDAGAIEQDSPSEQELLQQRQKQEDYIRRNAKHISPTLHAKMKSAAPPARPDTFSRMRGGDDGAGPLGGPTIDDLERQKSAISGSDEKAASYLAKVAQSKSDAAGLRPEMFTIKKEEEMKARGAEMITRDRTYDPQKEPPAPAYKPKVSTWGVFPRPADISKAYGGGRTIQPDTPQDSEARAKERSDRLQATITEYRKRQGLFIDPEEEAKWMAAYQAGLEMMQGGQLQGAAECFDKVSKAVPMRSKLGGEAQLQRAICLDSVGRNDEAYKIYMTLERHPAPEIQKGAKKMLFGFRAADNLKTKSMTYSASTEDWEHYFTRFSSGEWNGSYVSEGEPEDTSIYTYIAAAVILTPLILLAYLILR